MTTCHVSITYVKEEDKTINRSHIGFSAYHVSKFTLSQMPHRTGLHTGYDIEDCRRDFPCKKKKKRVNFAAQIQHDVTARGFAVAPDGAREMVRSMHIDIIRSGGNEVVRKNNGDASREPHVSLGVFFGSFSCEEIHASAPHCIIKQRARYRFVLLNFPKKISSRRARNASSTFLSAKTSFPKVSLSLEGSDEIRADL